MAKTINEKFNNIILKDFKTTFLKNGYKLISQEIEFMKSAQSVFESKEFAAIFTVWPTVFEVDLNFVEKSTQRKVGVSSVLSYYNDAQALAGMMFGDEERLMALMDILLGIMKKYLKRISKAEVFYKIYIFAQAVFSKQKAVNDVEQIRSQGEAAWLAKDYFTYHMKMSGITTGLTRLDKKRMNYAFKRFKGA